MTRPSPDPDDEVPATVEAQATPGPFDPTSADPDAPTAHWPLAPVPDRLGPYEIQGMIGRGGMGMVLRALDPRLGRLVAIKVLAPELAAQPIARARFDREARTAAAVNHEHVVTVHAVNDSGNSPPYLVMQLAEGPSLQEHLDAEGPPTLAEALRIGREVAEGLAAAHALGIAHRDIKPANILLDGPRRRVRISDFGLARAADDAALTGAGIAAGTPAYMAPEQARGEALDHRADLYSLGSLLFVLLDGRPPFEASSTYGLIHRVGRADPRSPREIGRPVPEPLAALIERLHAPDPADRPSAVEVAEELDRIASTSCCDVEPHADRRPPTPSASTPKPAPCSNAEAETVALFDASLAKTEDRAPPTSPPRPLSRGQLAGLVAAGVLVVAGLAFILLPHGDRTVPSPPTPPPIVEKASDPPPPPRAEPRAAAQVRLGSAIAALSAGEVWQALIDLDEALRLDPGLAEAHVHRGRAHEARGDRSAALTDYRRALHLDPVLAGFDASLLPQYWDLSRPRGPGQPSDKAPPPVEEVLAESRIALQRWPGRADPHLFHATALRLAGKPDEALTEVERALEIARTAPRPDPRLIGNTLTIRAWIRWLGQSDQERALADLDEAIRVDPEASLPRLRRADLLLRGGQDDQAAEDLEAVWPLWPVAAETPANTSEAHRLRAWAHQRRGRHEQAVAAYSEAIRADPGVAGNYGHRGESLLRLGRDAEALQDFETALRLDPNDATATRRREQVLRRLSPPSPGEP